MNNEDLRNETPSERPLRVQKEPWHPDKAKMALAYWVLLGIFLFFIVTIFTSFFAKCGYFDKEVSNSLFEICRTGLLPIITLILGYYFSKP